MIYLGILVVLSLVLTRFPRNMSWDMDTIDKVWNKRYINNWHMVGCMTGATGLMGILVGVFAVSAMLERGEMEQAVIWCAGCFGAMVLHQVSAFMGWRKFQQTTEDELNEIRSRII